MRAFNKALLLTFSIGSLLTVQAQVPENQKPAAEVQQSKQKEAKDEKQQKGDPCYPPDSKYTEKIKTPPKPAKTTTNLLRVLEESYKHNQSINQQRYATRAIDEKIGQATSRFLPKLDAQVTLRTREERNSGARRRLGLSQERLRQDTVGGNLTVTQNIYNGGADVAARNGSEARARAARFTLSKTEQNSLLQTVQSYMDVYTKEAEVKLRRANADVLRKSYLAAKDKFDVGEETRTAVAQALVSSEEANAQLATAKAELEGLRASYEALTTTKAGNLARPADMSRLLPTSLAAALDTAKIQNPSLREAEANMYAARYDVEQRHGELLPKVDLTASAGRTKDLKFKQRRIGFRTDTDKGTVSDRSAQLAVSWRVYNPEGYALKREAHDNAEAQRINRDNIQSQVMASVISAWENYIAAKANLRRFKARADAALVAYDGTKEEVLVGNKTFLEELRANAALINSRVDLLNAEKAYFVAIYNLLAQIGELTPERLALHVKTYNPFCHYEHVKDAIL